MAALTGRVSGRMEWAAQPGEQRAGALAAEPSAAEHRRGQQRRRAEAGEQQRVAGEVRRAEDLRQISASGWWRNGPTSRLYAVASCPKDARGHLQGFAQDDRRLAVERVGNRRARLDPGQPMFGERESRKERRQDPERMRGRADVVVESRQRQLCGAGAAADRIGRLEHEHRRAVARQLDRGREAVRATPDDHGVQACRQGDPLRSRSGSDDLAARQHHPVLADGFDTAALELLLVDLWRTRRRGGGAPRACPARGAVRGR